MLIRAIIIWVSIISLISCGGGGGDPPVTPPEAKISISGTIKVPGGTESPDNPLGLQSAANRAVSLFKVSNQGNVIGDALDSTISDQDGHYVLVLPDDIEISSKLIVQATLDNDRPIRAIVLDENTDITPITEYITEKIINDPDLDLDSLPASEVIDLIAFVESLELDSQEDLADTLTHIAQVSDGEVDDLVDDLAVTYNPQIRLSGLLSVPAVSSESAAANNGLYAARPVANTNLNLYRIDNSGNIIGTVLATTTTDSSGAYSLVLPDGFSLSSDLILRAEVSPDIFLSALVVNEQLNVDATSQYVFTQVVEEPDIVLATLPTSNVYELVTYIASLNIPETSDLTSTLIAIDSDAGVAIASQINDIKAISTASLGFWGSSNWGASSYH
jgi:hypothetical protein